MSSESVNYEARCETYKHIKEVSKQLNEVADSLLIRANLHDKSKLEEPEASAFEAVTGKLKNLTYGSDEYNHSLKELESTLKLHYSKNRHHPEFFENGIHGMNLIDLIEMLVDWHAATLRHDDGDIFKSIEFNQKRFGYSDELKGFLINTVNYWYNGK